MAIIQNLEAFVQSYPAGLDSVTDLQLSQNENGRQIRFTIGGVTIPAGSTATISGTKPDGVVYSNTGTIEGSDTVIFDEDVQMTAVFGTWYAKIRITNAGNTIASARVRFIIDKDPVDAGAIPSESQLNGLVAEAEEYAGAAEDAAERAAITYGSPLTAATASAMTDINRVYVYTGSESGYTYGNWYYYNGSAWVSGGVYNSAAVETDTTLTESGVPADAKATGDKIDELKDDLSHIEGISDEVKQALLACFRGVAWLDWEGSGESLYNALEEALYDEPAPDPRIVYEIPHGTDISTWAIDTEQHAYTLDEDFTILAKASIDMSSQESGTFLLDSLSRTAPTVGCRLQSGLSNNAVNFTATFNQGSAYGGIGGTTNNTFSKSTHNVIFIMTNYNKYMTVAIYVDGNIELQSSNTLTDKEGAVYPPTYYIGMHQGGVARPWPGTVDLFRIYNEALSNNEINEILGLG